MASDTIDPALLARLQADQEWSALKRELDAARTKKQEVEAALVAARELAAKPAPPATRPIPGTWGIDPRRETNPDYTAWLKAKATVRQYDNPELLGDDSALKALEALRKQVSDLEHRPGRRRRPISRTRRPTAPHPGRQRADRDHRPPRPGTARPITRPTPPPISRREGVDTRLVGKPKGTTIGREIEAGPGGNRYYVEYFYGPDGRKGAVASDEAHRPVQVGGGLGADPNAQVTLQTAQTNLEIARQRLAEATSPEARQKAQLEVQQAQLALQTAQLGLEQTRRALAHRPGHRPDQPGPGPAAPGGGHVA